MDAHHALILFLSKSNLHRETSARNVAQLDFSFLYLLKSILTLFMSFLILNI